jgi:hypothetical protein
MVVPFLLPIMKELELVYQIYNTGGIDDAGIVLTEVGAKGVETLISLVEACKGVEFAGWDTKYGDLKAPNDAVLKTLFVKMPAGDGKTDGKMQHYLLTRVYYQAIDLWNQSLKIETIGKREVVPELLEIEVVVGIKEEEFERVEGQEGGIVPTEEDLIELNSSGDELSYLDDLEDVVEPIEKAVEGVNAQGSAREVESTVEEPGKDGEVAAHVDIVEDREIEVTKDEVVEEDLEELEKRLAKLNSNE